MSRSRRLATAVAIVASACYRGTQARPVVPLAPLPLASLTEEQRDAMAIAYDSTYASRRDTAAICLTVRGTDSTLFDPDARLIERLAVPRRIVRRHECPPTLSSMIYVPRRIPPGHVDPYRVTISVPRAMPSGHLMVQLEVAQGTGTMYYECETWREAAKGQARCRPLYFRVS